MKNVKRKEMHPDITAIKGYTRKWFLDKKKKMVSWVQEIEKHVRSESKI